MVGNRAASYGKEKDSLKKNKEKKEEIH